MASSSGSASVAPTPCRNVRRGRDILVRNMIHSPLAVPRLSTLTREGLDRDASRIWNGTLRTMPRTIAPKPVVVAGGAADDGAHRRHVVVIEPAPERVGQQLLGQSRSRTSPAAAAAPAAAPPDRSPGCRRPACPTRRSASPDRRCARRRRRRSSRARTRADPSPGGTTRTAGWRGAPPGARARSPACPARCRPARRPRRGAAAAAACPRMFSRTHLPRTTGDVRFGYDVTARTLACPSRPKPRRVGQRHPPEVAAVDAAHPVVARQPLVDEGVVGAQQIERRCGPRAAGCRGTSPSRVRIAWRSESSNSGKSARSGTNAARLRRCSHWPPKFLTSDCARGSASIRRTSRSSTAGCPSRCRGRGIEQLLVGNAAPQEERQPRRQIEVADPVRRSRPPASADPARRGTGNSGWSACPGARPGSLLEAGVGPALAEQRRAAAGGRPRSRHGGRRGAPAATGWSARTAARRSRRRACR